MLKHVLLDRNYELCTLADRGFQLADSLADIKDYDSLVTSVAGMAYFNV